MSINILFYNLISIIFTHILFNIIKNEIEYEIKCHNHDMHHNVYVWTIFTLIVNLLFNITCTIKLE